MTHVQCHGMMTMQHKEKCHSMKKDAVARAMMQHKAQCHGMKRHAMA